MIADMKDKGDFKINGGQCLCDGVLLEKNHGMDLKYVRNAVKSQLFVWFGKVNYKSSVPSPIIC